MWGTQAEFAALRQRRTAEGFLVLGPWDHGGWEDRGEQLGGKFGTLDFGEPTGSEYYASRLRRHSSRGI